MVVPTLGAPYPAIRWVWWYGGTADGVRNPVFFRDQELDPESIKDKATPLPPHPPPYLLRDGMVTRRDFFRWFYCIFS